MNSTSKISALPRRIRSELNLRLESGASIRETLAWLNASRVIRKILAAHFAGRPINKQNLAAWKAGDGYRQWLNHQAALDLARELASEALDYIAAGNEDDARNPVPGSGFADKVSHWFSLNYIAMARTLIATTQNGDIHEKAAAMRGVNRDLALLRRADHSAARLQIERERWAFERERLDAERATTIAEREQEFWRRAALPEVQRRAEEIQRENEKEEDERIYKIRCKLFGKENIDKADQDDADALDPALSEDERNRRYNERHSDWPEPFLKPVSDPARKVTSPDKAHQSKTDENLTPESAASPEPVESAGSLEPVESAESRELVESIEMALPPESQERVALFRFDGWTALHEAAKIGRKDIVDSLIAHGADVNARDIDLRTPLHEAAVEGHIEIARALLAANAEINSPDAVARTPLSEARAYGHDPMSNFLIAQGAEPGQMLKSPSLSVEMEVR